MADVKSEPPKKLWKNNVDAIDLLILKRLQEGRAETTLEEDKVFKQGLAKMGIKRFSRTKIKNRIQTLVNKGILLRKVTIIVDPTQLFDHVLMAFIKVRLTGMYGNGKSWQQAYEDIDAVNKEFGEPIRLLFNIAGTGEYDFIAIVYTSNIERYHQFKAELARKGSIEKFDTKSLEPEAGYSFDPITIPDWEEAFKTTEHYYKVIKEMNK